MIGILEAGAPPTALRGEFEGYAAMFRKLLGPGISTQTFDVVRSALPAPDRCQAWLITGSAGAAYDNAPWIAGLSAFVRNVPASIPMAGVCFGHQVMAQTFGGVVAKAPKGRALGLHRYDIWRRAAWMDDGAGVSLPVGHQDQVVAIGPECAVLGGSEFTPFGILAYPGRRAFSIQSHPEFSVEFARALVELRRKEVGNDAADLAAASLHQPNDSPRAAEWLRRFLISA